MNSQFLIENAGETQRLCKLVNSLTDEELSLPLYSEGWAVSAALAHIAFWDRRRLVLIRKWKQHGVKPSPIDQDVVNDALIPFFSAIPPREAAALAALTAEALDQELADASPDLIAAMEATGDRHALNRSAHRKMHLDDIETLLGRITRS